MGWISNETVVKAIQANNVSKLQTLLLPGKINNLNPAVVNSYNDRGKVFCTGPGDTIVHPSSNIWFKTTNVSAGILLISRWAMVLAKRHSANCVDGRIIIPNVIFSPISTESLWFWYQSPTRSVSCCIEMPEALHQWRICSATHSSCVVPVNC